MLAAITTHRQKAFFEAKLPWLFDCQQRQMVGALHCFGPTKPQCSKRMLEFMWERFQELQNNNYISII
jgi:hypothetical protein